MTKIDAHAYSDAVGTRRGEEGRDRSSPPTPKALYGCDLRHVATRFSNVLLIADGAHRTIVSAETCDGYRQILQPPWT